MPFRDSERQIEITLFNCIDCMKKKGGYLPEAFDDDEEESEFRQIRRYYRKKLVRLKPKRWRKRR